MTQPTQQQAGALGALGTIDQTLRREFDANRRLLSFEQYLALLASSPETAARQFRGTATYVADMLDHFGELAPKSGDPVALPRFRLFDQAEEDGVGLRVVGQESVQRRLYQGLRAFSRQGQNNRLLLLHGPNGSAKSSVVRVLMQGMERYSREPEGAVYAFNWIFPHERSLKPGLGLNPDAYAGGGDRASYAHLVDDEISARVPCEMKDHPLLLVPREHRRTLLAATVGEAEAARLWERGPAYLTRGDVCHRCKQVFEALLTSYAGDFKRVLQHVQVERFYYARRYRRGLVTIEPQMHVDASYQLVTMNRSFGQLPAALQGLNFFSLAGDLVDGNRGLIEYSDLLKRPVDAFKYLLTACESGAVNVGPSIAYLDAVMIGSTNEIQLDGFKEFPDFASFKARIELIRVPYLLSARQEAEIYAARLGQMGGGKHVSPHVAWAAAQWAVLTRLKKPNSIHYPPGVSSLVSALTPLEKARLYDAGEPPTALSPEEKKMLRSALPRLRDEYTNVPYYEGRLGASAREVQALLFEAAQDEDFPCLSPLAAFRKLEEFVKRVSEHEFLKQEIKDGYHDAAEFVGLVRAEYLDRIDREVRDSIGLYETAQWEDFLRRYVQQVSLVLRKEKTKNAITGKMEEPDAELIGEFERIVGAPAELEPFRNGVISQVGAWSLDHPGEPVTYARVFPEFWQKLEQHYFESQKSLLSTMSQALLQGRADGDGPRLARTTMGNLKSRYGYCDACAKEVVGFLMKSRY